MSDTHVYDKSKYHMTGQAGGAASWENASGPALFFLRWSIDHNLVSNYFIEESEESLVDYRGGRCSFFHLYEKEWDMVLLSEMFSEEGNAFALGYFEYDTGRYLQDLFATLNSEDDGYVVYSEDDYLRFKPLLDSRYAAWKAGDLEVVRKRAPAKRWWQFWK
jgi:hypothetical protein